MRGAVVDQAVNRMYQTVTHRLNIRVTCHSRDSPLYIVYIARRAPPPPCRTWNTSVSQDPRAHHGPNWPRISNVKCLECVSEIMGVSINCPSSDSMKRILIYKSVTKSNWTIFLWVFLGTIWKTSSICILYDISLMHKCVSCIYGRIYMYNMSM